MSIPYILMSWNDTMNNSGKSRPCYILQDIATLLGATCCVRLATSLRRIATYWVLLAQIWKWSNFPCNICECCMSFGQVRTTMLRLGMRTSSIFNSQHVATRRNTVAKRVQHVAPNNVAIFNCWDSLAGAWKCWANNVGICCVQMLRSFGRGLMWAMYSMY